MALKIPQACAGMGSIYTKIGTIQRIFAQLLHKDDTQVCEVFIFLTDPQT